jgi:hypothetical protein
MLVISIMVSYRSTETINNITINQLSGGELPAVMPVDKSNQ